ncbi:uncharacterized protein LOC120170895 isoform X2 [Hibiscus syriacus]|nr:uncharacterized protein LOC120170895 isoform X2 [Hibiscus syriacus]
MGFLRKSLDRHFSPDEVLQLLDRFYNLEVLKPDDEEIDILNHDEDFCLPQSYFVKVDPKQILGDWGRGLHMFALDFSTCDLMIYCCGNIP